MDFSYHHTGKYDLATDKFIGGCLRTYVTIPHPQIPGQTKRIHIDADTKEDLKGKWEAASKGQK